MPSAWASAFISAMNRVSLPATRSGEHPGDVVAGREQHRLEDLALGQPLARLDPHDGLTLSGVPGLGLRLVSGDAGRESVL